MSGTFIPNSDGPASYVLLQKWRENHEPSTRLCSKRETFIFFAVQENLNENENRDSICPGRGGPGSSLAG